MNTFDYASKTLFLQPLETEILSEVPKHGLFSMSELSLPYRDKEDRIIQLWNSSAGLISTVLNQTGNLNFIAGNRIRLPTHNATPEEIVQKMQNAPLRIWDLTFDVQSQSIMIWPHLKAMGKDQFFSQKPAGIPRPIKQLLTPYKNATKEQVEDSLIKHGFFKNFSGDWERSHTGNGRKQTGMVIHIDDGVDEGEPPHIDIRYTNRDFFQTLNKRRKEKVRDGLLLFENKIREAKKSKDPQLVERLTVQHKNLSRFGDLRLKWRFGYGGEGGVKEDPTPKGASSKSGEIPGTRQFAETVRTTGLVKSYNSSHPDNPIPEGSSQKEIGGVACSMEYLEGLFDSSEALFENSHLICLKTLTGDKAPFSDKELRQIIREIAIGVYAHGTVPFFSLHFNQTGDLFPVIHPAYENTLVGRVIGMLDYIMKGYLNGGIFNEAFVQNWHKRPDFSQDPESALSQLIDFEEYCQENLQGENKNYNSLRQMLEASKDLDILAKIFNKDEIIQGSRLLNDPQEFTNSFRIISKIKKAEKEGNLLFIDSDFDVEYTIKPSPSSKEAVAAYEKIHGHMPEEHLAIFTLFEEYKKRIHDHMSQFPLCKEYFSMLSVITFLSSYFSTLKNHRKVPLLDPMEKINQSKCPPLFPHLPVKRSKKTEVKINLSSVVSSLAHYSTPKIFFDMLLWLLEGKKINEYAYIDNVQQIVTDKINQYIAKTSSATVRHYVKNHLYDQIKEISQGVIKVIDNLISAIVKELKPENHTPAEYQRISSQIPEQLPKLFENQEYTFFSISTPFLPIDISPTEKATTKRIIGGCSLNLEQQKVEHSKENLNVIEQNWTTLSTIFNETWTQITLDNKSTNIFRLEFEDLLPWEDPEFSWITSLLQRKNQETNLEDWNEVMRALKEENFAHFIELIGKNTKLIAFQDDAGRTLLHHSVLIRNPIFTEKLIELGSSLTLGDNQGYTALHYAAMRNSERHPRTLLNKGSNINAKAYSNATPLIVAIQHGSSVNVNYFLRNKAQNVTLTNGSNALHVALQNGYFDTAKNLIEKGFITKDELNACSEEGGTPLMIACKKGSLNTVKMLLKAGANPYVLRKDGVIALEIAAKMDFSDIVIELLKSPCPIPGLICQAIESIAREGSASIITIMMDQPFFVSYKNHHKESVLHLAARHANAPAVHVMLEKMNLADIEAKDSEGKSAVDIAIAAEYWLLILAFHKKGVNFHREDRLLAIVSRRHNFNFFSILEPLNLSSYLLEKLTEAAAISGNYENISMALEKKGADISKVKGPNEWTILHYLAKANGIFLFTRELKKAKHLLLSRDAKDKTLPYIAAENGSTSVLRYLLEEMKKAKMPPENHFAKKHLLYGVISSMDKKCIDLYFEMFPEIPSIIDFDGTTASHLAAKLDLDYLFPILKEKKVEFDVENSQGLTPLYYAIGVGSLKIVQFLVDQKVTVGSRELYLAATEKKDDKIFQIIWDHSEFFSVPNPKGPSATALAIYENNHRAFKRLVQAGASCNSCGENGEPLIIIASRQGSVEILQEMFTHKVKTEVKFEEKNALEWAIVSGQTEAVLLLINKGLKAEKAISLAKNNQSIINILDIDYKEYKNQIKAFNEAFEDDSLEKMSMLINQLPLNERIVIYRTNFKTHCATPLQFLFLSMKMPRKNSWKQPSESIAVSKQRLNKALHWVSLGANPNQKDSQGNTLAHLLVMAGISPVSIPGIDLQATNHKKQTPYHLAARHAYINVFESLHNVLTEEEKNAEDYMGKTAVYYAVKAGNEDVLSLLHNTGADLQHYDRHLRTPLLYANTSFKMTKELVALGVNVNQIGSKDKKTAFFQSVEQQAEMITYYLLENGANPLLANIKEEKPIHIASYHNNVRLIASIGAADWGVGHTNKDGFKAIHIAAQRGHIEALKVLKQNQCRLDSLLRIEPDSSLYKTNLNNASPLFLALNNSKWATVDWLLANDPYVKETIHRGSSPLHAASHSPIGLEKILKYESLETHEGINEAAAIAISKDKVEALKTLFSFGVSVDSPLKAGNTPLHIASISGSLHSTYFLIQEGASLKVTNDANESALELAAGNKSVNQFKLLLENVLMEEENSVNKIGRHCRSLAHTAAEKGNLLHLMVLLNFGADLDSEDAHNETPLHLAAKAGKTDVVHFLLAYGARADLKSIFGHIPSDLVNPEDNPTKKVFQEYESQIFDNQEIRIHLATRLGNIPAILLLSQTDDVNEQDEKGRAALHIAAQKADTRAIMALLEQGADVNIEDDAGISPLWIACLQNPNLKVAQLLIKAGAVQHKVQQALSESNLPEKDLFIKECA